MQLTQRTALDLFEERGFEEVTVTEIADAVGMAPSTLYRHFSTKEAIVLWDEHDASLDDAFVAALTNQPPFEALRSVFVHEVGRRYDDDLEFQLRRVRYLYRTEALHAAAIEADFVNTAELTVGLESALSKRDRAAAPILSRAAMAAVDVAFDRWQASNGATPLGRLIDEAFDALARLEELR